MTVYERWKRPKDPDLGTIWTFHKDRSQGKQVWGIVGTKINEGGSRKMDFQKKKNILAECQDAICNKFVEFTHKNVWR